MNKILSILDKLVLAGVAVILIVAPTQYGLEIGKKIHISPVDPLLWCVFLLWLIGLACRRCSFAGGPSLFGIFLIIAAALSIFRASNRLESLKEVFQLVEYFVVASALFISCASERRNRMILVWVFIGTGVAILLLSLFQYLQSGTTVLAVAGTFGNRNVLGGFLSLMLPLLLGLLLYDTNNLRRAGYLTAIAIGFLVNLSGGSLLGILMAFVVLAMVRGRSAFILCTALLLVGTLFAGPFLPRNNPATAVSSIRLFDDDGNLSRRYIEWEAATMMTSQNPLLGVGAGNYQENIGMYYGMLPDPTGPTEPDTQNLYLVLASSIGLPGLAAFLGLLLLAGVQAVRQFNRVETGIDRGLALGILGSVIAFAIASLWSPLLVRGIGVPLVFILTLATVPPANASSGSQRTA